jgi:hypothetical protein
VDGCAHIIPVCSRGPTAASQKIRRSLKIRIIPVGAGRRRFNFPDLFQKNSQEASASGWLHLFKYALRKPAFFIEMRWIEDLGGLVGSW